MLRWRATVERSRWRADRRSIRAYGAALAICALLTACRSGGWVYRNSAKHYGDPDSLMASGLQTYGQAGLEGAAVTLLWPVVFDTLILPVSLAHDFFFMDDEEEDALPDQDGAGAD